MRLISTNIGDKKEVEWKGKLVETGIFKYSTDHPIYLGKTDVRTDHVIDRKYHGGIDKACYAYSYDHYPFWKDNFPNVDLSYGAFGENLTIEGLNESEIMIGDRFQIGENVIVEVSQPRQPCMKLGIRFNDQKVVKRFINEKYSGFYLRVIQEGYVKSGDKIKRLSTKKANLSVSEIHSLLSKYRNNDLAERALLIPELANSYKVDIKRIYNL